MTENNKILVAVYGSLKKGFGNHRLLSGSEFVGEGQTLSFDWDMLSFIAYPALIPSEKGKGNKVKVEVYSVTPEVFSRLDSLEGYPSFYDRKKVKVAIDTNSFDYDGKFIETCWIYYIADYNKYNRSAESFVKPDQNRYLEWIR
jgi:gamma-glutamylaminecyclotransferase